MVTVKSGDSSDGRNSRKKKKNMIFLKVTLGIRTIKNASSFDY